MTIKKERTEGSATLIPNISVNVILPLPFRPSVRPLSNRFR